jgi:Tfp pilus assembly protein PilF
MMHWRRLWPAGWRGWVKLLVILLALGLLGLGGYRAGLHFYVEHHLRAAEEASARYEFEQAQQHLAACLWARPRSGPLHLEAARAARRAEHYDQAEEHLRQCQRLEGKNTENALEAILLRVQAGDLAESEKLLQEQVDRGVPEAPLILEALAQGYIYTYRLDGARYCLDRLLEREPDNVLALLLRASLSQTAGNHPGAEKDYRRAIAIQPEHREARRRFGEFLLNTKRGEEALAQFDYLRQRPGGDQPDVLLGLARAYRQLGQTEAARQALDELLQRDPDNGFGLIERGKIALVTESPADAELWFRRAVAQYPYDPQVNYLLGQCLSRQGRDEEARTFEAASQRIEKDLKQLEAVFRRIMKSPRDPQPRLEAAQICLRNGRADEGERWLLSALQQAPQDAATRAALAEHYERTGRTDLADAYRRPARKDETDRLSPVPH